MAITRDEFLSLRKGDKIVDGGGREWIVFQNSDSRSGFTDVPGPREITLEIDGDYHDFGWSDRCIMDDEWGMDINLNHPSARVVRAD